MCVCEGRSGYECSTIRSTGQGVVRRTPPFTVKYIKRVAHTLTHVCVCVRLCVYTRVRVRARVFTHVRVCALTHVCVSSAQVPGAEDDTPYVIQQPPPGYVLSPQYSLRDVPSASHLSHTGGPQNNTLTVHSFSTCCVPVWGLANLCMAETVWTKIV